MHLSIVIPTLNEKENIGPQIDRLRNCIKEGDEIIVVDGGSDDGTIEIIQSKGVSNLQLESSSRAKQMNRGAAIAQNELLYFLHADAIPPESFRDDVLNKVNAGYDFGGFRFRFMPNRGLLKLNSFFTRFNWLVCRGGDQSLFIKKSIFENMKGFDEEFVIMEDFDLIQRLRKRGKFGLIQKDVLVSPRKYETNGWWKVNRANYLAFRMFKKGKRPELIRKRYLENLNLIRY